MSHTTNTDSRKGDLYGMIAEFDDPEHLVSAADRAWREGYRKLDAYSPFPVHGLSEALRLGYTWVPPVVLAGGLGGALLGFGLQYYTAVIDYPVIIGGRPALSWPSFIPITFEVAILCAGFATAIGMIMLNDLPRPHHPVFNAPGFERATRDGFFLCIEAEDDQFDATATGDFLRGLDAKRVEPIEYDE
jgi:hypothetical protein